GLVARDEQDRRSFLVAVDVLEPGTAGHCEIIESLPIEMLAVDDRVSLALERSDQQARGLPDRASFFARAQRLRDECHGLEHRAAGQRVGVFDRQRLVGIAVPVYEALDQLLDRLPTVDVAWAGKSGAALVLEEAGLEAAVVIGPR